MKSPRVSLICPKHKTRLARLKWQEAGGEDKSPVWQMTDWFWCTGCKKPIQVKMEIIIP